MSEKNALKEYKKGINYLKTSCLKCRFSPDYTSAIPYLKTSADEFHNCNNFEKELEARQSLINCFQKEESFWEEAKEYEKMSNIYLSKLKSPSDAYDSIEKAYTFYNKNHSYEDGIKALTKASDNFIENENEAEAEKCLETAFNGIKKYYHVMTMNENESQIYIYDCIDKQIDFLFGKEKYKKSEEIAKKTAEIIKKEKSNEIILLDKYYGLQAISEILDKQDNKYKDTLEKGMNVNIEESGVCNRVNYLMDKIKEKNTNEDKSIMDNVYEISAKVPNNVYKKLYRYVQDNKIIDDNINNEKDKITDFDDDSSDMK